MSDFTYAKTSFCVRAAVSVFFFRPQNQYSNTPMKEASNTMSIVPTKDFSATKVVDMIKTGKYKFRMLHHNVMVRSEGSERNQADERRHKP